MEVFVMVRLFVKWWKECGRSGGSEKKFEISETEC